MFQKALKKQSLVIGSRLTQYTDVLQAIWQEIHGESLPSQSDAAAFAQKLDLHKVHPWRISGALDVRWMGVVA